MQTPIKTDGVSCAAVAAAVAAALAEPGFHRAAPLHGAAIVFPNNGMLTAITNERPHPAANTHRKHHTCMGASAHNASEKQTYSVFGVEARMNDSVHIQVQVVELCAIGIGLRGVYGDFRSIDPFWHLFDAVDNDLGVFLAQPSIKRGNTHFYTPPRTLMCRLLAFKGCRTTAAQRPLHVLYCKSLRVGPNMSDTFTICSAKKDGRV